MFKSFYKTLFPGSNSSLRSISTISTPVFVRTKTKSEVSFKELKLLLNGTISLNVPNKVYLAATDPGLGKTTSIIEFIREWKDRGFIPDKGILVCFSSTKEINAFVDRCGMDAADFCVLTADLAFNAKHGATPASNAPVLITTQQYISGFLRSELFSDIDRFFYQGCKRNAVIWDEGYLPAIGITIRLDDIDALASPLRTGHPDFIDEVEEFAAYARSSTPPSAVAVPIELWRLARKVTADKRTFDALPAAARDTISNLIAVAGKGMIRGRNVARGELLTGCSKPLADDFGPVIVFDGSARVKITYDLMERHSGRLVRLTPAVLDYSPVKIRFWPIASGRSTLTKNDVKRAAILDEVAVWINATPATDEWLIVHPKKAGKLDIAKELGAKVSDSSRVHFQHWGTHYATNEYRHVKNIVIIGAWLMDDTTHQAAYMAATGLPARRIKPDDWAALPASDFKHNLLQAGSRGTIRDIKDDVCGEANLYVIASGLPDLPALIADTFPGCTVEEIRPLKKSLIGRADAAFRYISTELMSSSTVQKSEICKALGIEKQYLTKICNMPAFKQWLNDAGINKKHYTFERPLTAY